METSEINPGARSVVDKKGKMITLALRGVFLLFSQKKNIRDADNPFTSSVQQFIIRIGKIN